MALGRSLVERKLSESINKSSQRSTVYPGIHSKTTHRYPLVISRSPHPEKSQTLATITARNGLKSVQTALDASQRLNIFPKKGIVQGI
jgi:hypothetical protein